ncbi:MAG: hypothetical protein WCS37_09850 [Chloroflexota bacterium]
MSYVKQNQNIELEILKAPLSHLHIVNPVSDQFEMKLGEMNVREINGLPLIVTDRPPLDGLNAALKRTFDLFG